MKFRFLLLSVFLSGLLIMNMLPFAHQMKTTVQYEPLSVQQMARFHGHLGPFVVLGACMKMLFCRTFLLISGLQVTVECPKRLRIPVLLMAFKLVLATMGKTFPMFLLTKSGDHSDEETGRWLFTLKQYTQVFQSMELKNTDVEERAGNF